MKKLLLAIALFAAGINGANAQEGLQKAKFLDNWYLGVKGGVTTPMTFDHVFPLNPTAGFKLGKNFSPVFGANIEGLVGFGDNGFCVNTQSKTFLHAKTFAKIMNVGLNGTINLTNLFLGYNENKVFEVTAEAGVGYSYLYGDKFLKMTPNVGDDDELTFKSGLNFSWNLGAKKAWQFYVEPTVYWNLTNGPGDAVHFDRRAAQVGLFVGLNYKFLTSNGTHNFKKLSLDDLNNQINDLRNQLAAKPKEVIKTVEVIKEVPVEKTSEKTISVDNLYFVTFQQAKYILTPANKRSLNKIDAGRHVEIVGTASPEGSKAFNDRLSQSRADVVANYLRNRGVIVDRASGEGVKGVTSNRLAVVYVK